MAAGAAIGAAVLAGLADAGKALIEIERLNAQTDAVIRSTGGAANITRGQVEEMAEAAESATTIQRESVQEAANMLLTFTNIRNEVGDGNDIFTRATETVLDYSTALGVDAQSAALQLGKALNDPIKGLTTLGRAGVQFTREQKTMIENFVETGDLLSAQRVILDELATQFGGSAEAFADTTAGKIAKFQNDVGNMFESIVLGAAEVSEGIGDVFTVTEDEINTKMGRIEPTALAAMQATHRAIEGGGDQIREAAVSSLGDPLVEAMLGGKEEAERIASETPDAIAQALIDNQFSVEDASASLQQAAEDALHPMIERAQIIAFLSSTELADGLRDGVPAVRQRALELKQAAEARLAELQGASFTYGFNTGTSYAAGLNAAYGYVYNAASGLAAATRNQIGINSEPEDPNSPLRGITKWGGNLVDTYVGGMLGALGTAKAASAALAGSLVPALNTSLSPMAVGGAMGEGGGPTFILQVEGKPPFVGSKDDVLERWSQMVGFSDRSHL